MITVEVDPDSNVAILQPQGSITENDFETVRKIVDPYIDKTGRLDGVIVQARRFPDSEALRNLSSHMRFTHDQQERVSRVAVVSDSAMGNVKETLSENFTHADIQTFPFQDFEKAKRWVRQSKKH